jgi:putative peptidoglycan lipid II flippase
MQDTLFPTIFSTLAVLVSLPLYWYGMRLLGVNGVALAMSISAILQTTLLYTLWNRRTGNAGSRAVYKFFTKIILLSAGAGLGLYWLKINVFDNVARSSFMGSLFNCVLIGILFGFIFLAAAYAFRIEEMIKVFTQIAQQVGLKKPPKKIDKPSN